MGTENLNNYKEAYEESFKFYDENYWFLDWFSKRICNDIRKHRYQSVLSLGIGHKIVSTRINNEFKHYLKEYTILEGSKEIINRFRSLNKHLKKINIIHTYFEDYVPKSKFDAIEMGFILEHVDDPVLILKQFKKYLKKNGRLYVAVPNAKSLHRIIGHEAGLLKDYYKLSPADLELGHKRYFDSELFCRLITSTGFKILKHEGIMLKPITNAQIQQLHWDKKIIDALFNIGVSMPQISNGLYIEAIIK